MGPIRKNQTAAAVNALDALNQRIIQCELCPRLRAYGEEVARVRRRAYRDQQYWGKPVPSFGDPQARVLIVGLAPGAHGSNRTGRPFTGDGSGDFLYPTLYEAGYASQPKAISCDDGMQLDDARINSMARCAPPDNKPLPQELRNCSQYFDAEVALLPRLRVFVCLGKIAFDGVTGYLMRAGRIKSRAGYIFSHGAEHELPQEPGKAQQYIVASYHPSLQNTNTGRLTRPMFLKIFQRARELSE